MINQQTTNRKGKVVLEKYTFAEPHMGTEFKLILYAPDEQTASEAAIAAFDKIRYLNSVFSDYLPESEINRLSATAGTGQWVPASNDLFKVLRQAKRASRLSEGAFDVTAGPVVRQWRRARALNKLPDPEKVQAAQASAGYRLMLLDGLQQAVKLKKEGMHLDLGGIAKGYTADQVLETLKERGIYHALVDAGGDITAGEAPPGSKGWKVAVPAYKGGKNPKPLIVKNCAVATSGDQYRHLVQDGERYSHIIDPRTGKPLTNHRIVTVVAPSGMQADWLASALSVLDIGRGKLLVNDLKDVSYRVLVSEKNERLLIIATGIF